MAAKNTSAASGKGEVVRCPSNDCPGMGSAPMPMGKGKSK